MVSDLGIYNKILIPQDKRYDLKIDVDLSAPGLKNIFNDAAKTDVVNQAHIKSLTKADTLLIRNAIAEKWKDFHPEIEKIGELLERKHVQKGLSEPDEKSLNKHIKDLAKASELEPAEVVEAFIRERNSDLLRALEDKNIGGRYHDKRQDYVSNLNGGLNEIRMSLGDLFQDGASTYIVIPQFKNAAQGSLLQSAPLPAPGTADQWELLAALHEAEHATDQDSIFKKASIPEAYHAQLREIDSDLVVIRYLDRAAKQNEPQALALKNRYLQERQVASFMSGLHPRPGDRDPLDHDTASFIRVYESPGNPQLDLGKFREEKTGLLDKIKSKMQTADAGGRVDVGSIQQVMGAVQDILKEKPGNLTRIQRAEAESFIKDGRAMGYKPDMNYPKAPSADTEISLDNPQTKINPPERLIMSGQKI